MKIIYALVVLLLCAGCVHVPVTPAIEGIVRDSDSGGTIAGALISMRHLQRQELKTEAVSDRDGQFHLAPLKVWMPIGSEAFRVAAEIEVTKEGYETYSQELLKN